MLFFSFTTERASFTLNIVDNREKVTWQSSIAPFCLFLHILLLIIVLVFINLLRARFNFKIIFDILGWLSDDYKTSWMDNEERNQSSTRFRTTISIFYNIQAAPLRLYSLPISFECLFKSSSILQWSYFLSSRNLYTAKKRHILTS